MIKTYRNIPVLPIQEVLGSPKGRSEHKLGPIYPDWDGKNSARFHRNGRPKDSRPTLKDGVKLTYLRGTFAWGGPIVDHFGHQIADFSTRLAMYKNIDCKYIFSVGQGKGYNLDSMPKFMAQLLDWFGIHPDCIYFVEQPVIVDKLIVAPQQEQLSQVPPTDEYLSLMESLSSHHGINTNHQSGRYYISRAGQSKGVLAGESYIESLLRENGFKVIRPEILPLKEQLAIYAKASELVFSEGSAIYGIQLLGKIACDVHILQRRPNRTIAKACVQSRANSLNYYPVGKLVAGINKQGKPLADAGITIVRVGDLRNLLDKLKLSPDLVDEKMLSNHAREDVSRFMDNERKHKRAEVDGHIQTLEDQLYKLGLM